MRILIVNPHLGYVRGGAEVNDLNLGIEFRKMGHDVRHILVSDPRKPIAKDLAHVVAVRMRYWFPWALRQGGAVVGKVMRHAFEVQFVRLLLRQQRLLLGEADLILLTGRPLLASIRRHVTTPTFHSVRGLPNLRYAPLYRVADGVIFWGGCEKAHAQEVLDGLNHINLNAAVESQYFYIGPPDPVLVDDLRGGDAESVSLLYVGRLDPVNQVEHLLSAAATMIAEGVNLRVAVVGDGAMMSQLRELCVSLGIDQRARFLGRQPRNRIGDYCRAADIFMISPKIENHPISLKEAIACGTYAMGPTLGGVPGMIEQSGFGRVFPDNNPDALTDVLRAVLMQRAYDKKGANDKRGENARADSWQENARKILAFREHTLGVADGGAT